MVCSLDRSNRVRAKIWALSPWWAVESRSPGTVLLSIPAIRPTELDLTPGGRRAHGVADGVVRVDPRGRLCLTSDYARLLTPNSSDAPRRILVMADRPFDRILVVGIQRVRALVNLTGGAA